LEEWELRKNNTQISKGDHRKKCSICRQIGHNRNNYLDKPLDEQTATPAERLHRCPNCCECTNC